MRVDAHQHFWKYDAAEYGWIDDSMRVLRRDVLPSDSAREMARVGFDGCVAVQAQQTLDETRWLLSLADGSPSIVGVVGWVDLQADDVRAQLETVARHPKLIGVRHIVQSEPDDRFLLRPSFCRGIEALLEFDLAYDILIYSRQLEAAIEFVARFPRHRFVLDHLAKPPIRSRAIDVWERNLRRLAEHPNVLAKLSGLVTEADSGLQTADGSLKEQIRPYLDVAFDCFSARRLLIGSDWPVCTVAASYVETMSIVTDYLSTRPSDERDAVLGGSAERFWKLKTAAITGGQS